MKKIIIVKDSSRKKLIKNIFLEWVLYILCYSIILIIMSVLFKSLSISNEYYGLYAVLAAIIIYILNQTIKPVLFFVTLPITALTMGLFYPLINLLILYITSFILGDKFQVTGVIIPFFIAIFISLLNIVMEGFIIKPIIRSTKNNE